MLESDRIRATIVTEESELGRWTAAHWSPPRSSPLSGIIERIWYFEGNLTYARERVFPDGRAELIVMLDEPHRDGDTDPNVAFPAVCINGLRTRSSVVVSPRGHCRVLGIRFEPTGACMLLRDSMKDLVNVTIDLHDGIGRRAASELGERCADAGHAAAIINVAAQWASQQINGDAFADPATQWTAVTIRDARGMLSVDELASTLGLTRTRFAQRFRDRIGVTPKRFARIVRFHAALSQLQDGSTIAQAAADLAYFDQAHMYRDFSEFAGLTPGAFVSAKRYPGSPSVAEA